MPYLSKIMACVAVLVALWGIHEWDVSVQVKKATQKYETAIVESKKRTERAARALEASFVKAEKEKDEKINRISDDLTSAIGRLQQRPKRPNTIVVASDPVPCTGAELYKEDGEFLTREAARAERVLEERNYFWNRYEEARLKLEEIE